MAESKVSMKLLIDTHGKRVLFAEAGKDCVDFLFYILSLPVSTLINLIGKQGMVGSLANVYESIETLDNSYIQPNKTKNRLLKPVLPNSGFSSPLLTLPEAPATAKTFYRCSYCSNYSYVSDDSRADCPSCRHKMNKQMTYVAPPPVLQIQEAGGGGFVKEVVTYMVTDDLVVQPMSNISSITLLNKFNIKDLGSLQEKDVNLGMNEAVELVKASLQTKKALTSVFLNGIN